MLVRCNNSYYRLIRPRLAAGGRLDPFGWKGRNTSTGLVASVYVWHRLAVDSDTPPPSYLTSDLPRLAHAWQAALPRVLGARCLDGPWEVSVVDSPDDGSLYDAVLDGRVDALTVLPLLVQLAGALALAHSRGIVHGGIGARCVLRSRAGAFQLSFTDDRLPSRDAAKDVRDLARLAIFALLGADNPEEHWEGALALSPFGPRTREVLLATVRHPDRFEDGRAFESAIKTAFLDDPCRSLQGPLGSAEDTRRRDEPRGSGVRLARTLGL